MASVICVNCGVKISYMRGDKTPKICPRCKNNPSEKSIRKVGEYEKPKKRKKYFKEPDIIEEVKDVDPVPEVPESDWPD